MGDPVEIVDHDPGWAATFATLGHAMRAALGSVAVRIDHIGSTSVPGLAAKPVIDVQVAVRSFCCSATTFARTPGPRQSSPR